MVKGLHVLFDDDCVNVEQVISFLESYQSNPADWEKYATYDPHRSLGNFNVVLDYLFYQFLFSCCL